MGRSYRISEFHFIALTTDILTLRTFEYSHCYWRRPRCFRLFVCLCEILTENPHRIRAEQQKPRHIPASELECLCSADRVFLFQGLKEIDFDLIMGQSEDGFQASPNGDKNH